MTCVMSFVGVMTNGRYKSYYSYEEVGKLRPCKAEAIRLTGRNERNLGAQSNQ